MFFKYEMSPHWAPPGKIILTPLEKSTVARLWTKSLRCPWAWPCFDSHKCDIVDALSASLSRLFYVLADFPVSIDTLVQNGFPVFWFLPLLFHWH